MKEENGGWVLMANILLAMGQQKRVQNKSLFSIPLLRKINQQDY